MKAKWFWAGAVVFVLVSPFLVRAVSGRAQVEVDVVPAVPRTVRDFILASGNLIYQNEAALSPEIIARVQEVLVSEGDEVEEGQVLIRLDDQNIREAITLQRAQLGIEQENVSRQSLNVENLKLDFARIETLKTRGIASQGQYDNANYALRLAQADLAASRMRVKHAEAALAQAEEQLRRAVIKAPIAGTVITLGIKPGETAVPSSTGIPGSSLLTIAEKSSIMVDLNVDENDVSTLSVEGEASVSCPNSPDEGLNGVIREVALSPRRASGRLAANDMSGRSYSVKVQILNPDTDWLRQGMSCRATIFTSSPVPALAVPVQAILSDEAADDDGITAPSGREKRNDKYVYVVADGVAQRRAVSTGTADDEYQEITSGLREGDLVIVGPYREMSELTENVRVAPRTIEDKVNG